MSDDLRNAEIVRRYLAPESICVIARDHGLTRQRIQQIVTLEGASRDHLEVIRRRQKALLEREKRAEAAARISAFFARVIELRATGLSWTNTAASLGVPYAPFFTELTIFVPDIQTKWAPSGRGRRGQSAGNHAPSHGPRRHDGPRDRR